MSDVDLRGKRVFIRADLNVPIEDGRITDDTRIRASIPAIKYALEQGAAVMVTSHLGRPKEGELKPEDSLAPVAKRLGELLNMDVPLIRNWVDGVQVKPGQEVALGVEVPEAAVDHVIRTLRGATIRGQKVMVRRERY